MATDLLAKAKQKANRQEPKATKDDRLVLVLTPDEEAKVAKLCELATLYGEIDPLVKQHKKVAEEILFGHWAELLWKNKEQPDNPRVIIKKKDAAGNSTPMEDMKCLLQVKFRTAGLQTVLPDAAKLPEGKTVEEVLIETLTSAVVGLSEVNAKKFVAAEVEINDKVQLFKSFDELYYSEDPTEKSIGTKLLVYFQTRSEAKKTEKKKGKKTEELPPLKFLTEEEFDMLLVTKQEVTMKDGLFQRIHTYCQSVDEVRKLITYIKATIQVANFEFGISDEPKDRIARMQKAINTYLLPQT